MHRPQSLLDLRLVVDYIRALRNEVAIDEFTFSIAGLDYKNFGKIPRPTRWLGLAIRLPALSRWIQYISLPFWYLAAPILFWVQRRSIDFGNNLGTLPVRDSLGYVIGTSSRVMDIIHARHITPVPRLWLEFPWVPLESVPQGSVSIRAADLLCKADLQLIDSLARLAHRVLQRRRGFRGWGLQTYTAWRWFFARVVIDKLPGPLLIVEHFDRWAVLVDASSWASRVRSPERRLTLMQHGSVNTETPERRLKIALPTRLRGVNRLHVYSPEDEKVFRRDILSKNYNFGDIEVTYYRSLIELFPVGSKTKPSLLFVGHSLCENAHIALMNELTMIGDIQCFYKPHPTTGASKRIYENPWTVVQSRAVFPRVDMIVSYPSTMVAEYAEHNIPAVVHPMDISPEKARCLAKEVFCMADANWNAVKSAPTSHGSAEHLYHPKK